MRDPATETDALPSCRLSRSTHATTKLTPFPAKTCVAQITRGRFGPAVAFPWRARAGTVRAGGGTPRRPQRTTCDTRPPHSWCSITPTGSSAKATRMATGRRAGAVLRPAAGRLGVLPRRDLGPGRAGHPSDMEANRWPGDGLPPRPTDPANFDERIPSNPAGGAKPSALVRGPRLTVTEFVHGEGGVTPCLRSHTPSGDAVLFLSGATTGGLPIHARSEPGARAGKALAALGTRPSVSDRHYRQAERRAGRRGRAMPTHSAGCERGFTPIEATCRGGSRQRVSLGFSLTLALFCRFEVVRTGGIGAGDYGNGTYVIAHAVPQSGLGGNFGWLAADSMGNAGTGGRTRLPSWGGGLL